jgi:hypothetical protein
MRRVRVTRQLRDISLITSSGITEFSVSPQAT